MLTVMLITGIALIALGAYSSIIARRPGTPSYVDALLPYQGWLSCLCGISVLFLGVQHIGFALEARPVGAGSMALVGVLEVVFGLLLGYLGYRLLTRRGEEVRPYQTPLGYLAIVLGVWTTFEAGWFYMIVHELPVGMTGSGVQVR